MARGYLGMPSAASAERGICGPLVSAAWGSHKSLVRMTTCQAAKVESGCRSIPNTLQVRRRS
jgi:hypothetical protein